MKQFFSVTVLDFLQFSTPLDVDSSTAVKPMDAAPVPSRPIAIFESLHPIPTRVNAYRHNI